MSKKGTLKCKKTPKPQIKKKKPKQTQSTNKTTQKNQLPTALERNSFEDKVLTEEASILKHPTYSKEI